MDQKIADLGDLNDIEHQNSFVRMVMTKEKHAEMVKHQARILWGDYFKPEHLDNYPDLHDKVWQLLKQASKVKQGVDIKDSEKLIEQVMEFADIFAATKK